MPDRVFIASSEIKEQPKADESEETGGQCRVFVAVSGFDRQASQRTGILYCRMENDRVFMGGKAALYSIAPLFLPDGSVTG